MNNMRRVHILGLGEKVLGSDQTRDHEEAPHHPNRDPCLAKLSRVEHDMSFDGQYSSRSVITAAAILLQNCLRIHTPTI